MLKPVKLLICCLALLAYLSLYHASAQTVLTVREAEFRSRWTGPQEDRAIKPQYFEPDGGLTEKEAGESPPGQTLATLSENMDRLADNFRRRLHFGPLEFSLGVTSGWEYSSQTSTGEATNSAGRTSLFSSPTLAIRYEREIGPWSVGARFASGYTYYFNQDYTAAGQGAQRNPLSMTTGIDIGYNSTRLTLSLSATASTGSGYARYIITDSISTGAAASISYTKTSDAQVAIGQVDQPNSNTLNVGVSTFVDYLVSPKTNLRFILSAGEDLQTLQNGVDGGRRFADSMLMVTYQIAPKFSVDAGGGVGYVSDQDIANPESVGVRPVYNLGISYTPTEKTYFKTSYSFQGTDIRPNFSLVAGWNARAKTRLSLSVYQNQGFSNLSPDQYNVTRGALVTISQTLIKGISLSLSGGYEQSQYVALSSTENTTATEGPPDYFLTSATLSWRLREWASWQNTMMLTSGQGSSSSNDLQTRFSSSLNLNF
ncbi:MAG: hypothetical protein NTZ94_08120 [Verrucomicrobia bacterium]|nr:hypothetical protein [Verrucomicrobiota bacterium]